MAAVFDTLPRARTLAPPLARHNGTRTAPRHAARHTTPHT
jgi:hypothetical protein